MAGALEDVAGALQPSRSSEKAAARIHPSDLFFTRISTHRAIAHALMDAGSHCAPLLSIGGLLPDCAARIKWLPYQLMQPERRAAALRL
jgi:hypothetical protein